MMTRRNVRRAALLVATALLVLSMPTGPADAAWPGRDGRIAIESDATGTRQIYARDLDGDDLVQLTGAGSNDDPSWSPDGRHLAFDSDRTGVPQLYVMRHDGGHQHNVSPDGLCSAFPSWSPDGERLVFSHYPDTDCSGAPDCPRTRAQAGMVARRSAHRLRQPLVDLGRLRGVDDRIRRVAPAPPDPGMARRLLPGLVPRWPARGRHEPCRSRALEPLARRPRRQQPHAPDPAARGHEGLEARVVAGWQQHPVLERQAHAGTIRALPTGHRYGLRSAPHAHANR